VAFPSEAVQLERAWAWRSWPRECAIGFAGRLGPVACPSSEACLSADDVLGFCEGQLPGEHAARVQRHLEVCALCLELVAGAANRWASPEPADLLQVANNFRPGDRVAGRFEIVRFLARGGMGEVYEAMDMRQGERVGRATARVPCAVSAARRAWGDRCSIPTCAEFTLPSRTTPRAHRARCPSLRWTSSRVKR
jgi:hypothetical protein